MSGGTRSYEMAKRLVQMGHEVHLITSWREDTGDLRWFHSNDDGINVHWFPVKYSNNFGFFARIVSFIKFLLASTKKGLTFSADIVFASSTPLTVAIPGYFISKRLKVPMVFEVRDLWPELPIAIGALKNPIFIWLAKWLEKFAYKHSSMIVALSEGMKDGITASGFPHERIFVIPNSCDFELFSVKNKKERSIKFRNENNIPIEKKLVVYNIIVQY